MSTSHQALSATAVVLLLALATVNVRADDAPERPAEDPATAASTAAPDDDLPRFDVWEYQIEGNSLVEGALIERAVYPHLGPDRTIDDVEAARSALEKVYREQGLGTVLVDIPEQDVVAGIVRLTVTEGAVGRLKVTGSRYFSLGRIRSQVPSLAEGSVPHLPAVQKELQRLNQASPDRTVTPVLRPGSTPGTLEVELKVDDELPLHAKVELNDRFTQNTERLRLNAEVRYGNLWQREHAISAAYQVAPENRDNVEVFSSTYSFRLPDSDKVVTLYGVKTSSDVAAIGTLGVVGDGIIAGLRATLPLPALGAFYQSLTLGGDYKDFGESIDLLGADTLNTPINYHVWNALYSGVYLGDDADTEVSIGLTVALRGLGNNTREFQDKRFRAKPNFAFLTAAFSHLRPLPLGAQIYAALDGQVADSPLISNEQFGVGGVQSIRGYLESQQFFDDGLRASLELRSPDFGQRLWSPLSSARLHGFVEGASGRIQDALPGQPATATLWSAGLGFRLAAFDDFQAEFDWAVPFKASGTVDDGDSRVHFRL
ncbi:MAG: POTRA domain-containing protein, partial [Gammaproteobacteria bacterium]